MHHHSVLLYRRYRKNYKPNHHLQQDMKLFAQMAILSYPHYNIYVCFRHNVPFSTFKATFLFLYTKKHPNGCF